MTLDRIGPRYPIDIWVVNYAVAAFASLIPKLKSLIESSKTLYDFPVFPRTRHGRLGIGA